MADEGLKEGVEENATKAYLAERRRATDWKPTKETPPAEEQPVKETKAVEPDPALKQVLDKIAQIEAKVNEKDSFIEKLRKDNFKLREQRRKLREQDDPDDDDGGEDDDYTGQRGAAGRGKKVDPDSFDAMVSSLEERIMEKIAPVVHTVNTLSVANEIGAMASADPEVREILNNLPANVQEDLVGQVRRVVKAFGDDAGANPLREAIMFLGHRHIKGASGAPGSILPRGGTAPGPDLEDDTTKINRQIFGEEFLPRGGGRGR